MKKSVFVTPASLGDVQHVASHLREEDSQEVLVATGRPAYEVVLESYELSATWAVRFEREGEPVALAGVSSAAGPYGLVWMLCTPEVTRRPRAVLKAAREWLDGRLITMPVLRNVVWAENALHVGWLRLLGATFAAPVQHNGHTFIPFTIRSSNKEAD